MSLCKYVQVNVIWYKLLYYNMWLQLIIIKSESASLSEKATTQILQATVWDLKQNFMAYTQF